MNIKYMYLRHTPLMYIAKPIKMCNLCVVLMHVLTYIFSPKEFDYAAQGQHALVTADANLAMGCCWKDGMLKYYMHGVDLKFYVVWHNS